MARLNLLVLVAVCLALGANANVVGKSRVSGVVAGKRSSGKLAVEQSAAVVAAATKGKAAVAAPAGFFSKDVSDKLQLAGLFAVWYAFNAGCKLHLRFNPPLVLVHPSLYISYCPLD